jgi:Uma2 family endonuclease
MNGGYRGCNPCIERHLAIFVNYFCLERTNQLSLLPDKDLVDLCSPIEPYQVTKSRMNLPYRIPPKALVKLKDKETGYNPDLLLINRQNLINEPLWEKKSTLINGESIPLVIEVVSSNWRDDYGYKLVDYEAMGIKEYWIVDYLGIGGVRFIGQPKQPTLSIYQLIDGEYQGQRLREKDLINKSLIFPELNLTAAQVFQGQK